jgi:hypothetical protein
MVLTPLCSGFLTTHTRVGSVKSAVSGTPRCRPRLAPRHKAGSVPAVSGPKKPAFTPTGRATVAHLPPPAAQRLRTPTRSRPRTTRPSRQSPGSSDPQLCDPWKRTAVSCQSPTHPDNHRCGPRLTNRRRSPARTARKIPSPCEDPSGQESVTVPGRRRESRPPPGRIGLDELPPAAGPQEHALSGWRLVPSTAHPAPRFTGSVLQSRTRFSRVVRESAPPEPCPVGWLAAVGQKL